MPEFTVDVVVEPPAITEIDVEFDGPAPVVSVDVEFAPAPPISIDIEAAAGLPGPPGGSGPPGPPGPPGTGGDFDGGNF
jgi:hypothetical protein